MRPCVFVLMRAASELGPMKNPISILRRHWRKVFGLILLIAAGGVYAVSPMVRDRSHQVWHAAMAWAGLGAAGVDSGKVYWCPMHPQIKSNKENYVCPICNMALVELEGGIVDAPEHLTLTAQQIQQGGVVTQPVIRRSLYREIDTTGRIAYDERKLAKITSWIDGKSRIQKLHVTFMGQKVTEGEPLAELYSSDLIIAQQEFITAASAAANGGLTSSRSRRLNSPRMLDAGRDKLRYQGLSTSQIDDLARSQKIKEQIPILAPISGTVIRRHVQEGEYVAEGDVLFEIADLSTLWLYADVFEDELPLIKVGTSVELSVANRPDETFDGEVAFIDPMVDPATRSVAVRINVDNRAGKLMPGMFARVKLHETFPSLLAVPENAVLWSGQRAVAILKSGEGTYRPVEIETGKKWLYEATPTTTFSAANSIGFGEGIVRFHEITDGLRPGDEVVTAGAFLLNAESQFQSVLAKMLPPQSERVALEDVLGDDLAKRVRNLLDDYFTLSSHLSNDKIDAVPAAFQEIQASTEQLVSAAKKANANELAKDASGFLSLVNSLTASPLADAKDARTRFGRVSHELTKLLESHGGKTLFGKDLYQFECGMSGVGYERWLWWSPEIHNPYMGQKMLSCGTKLDVLDP